MIVQNTQILYHHNHSESYHTRSICFVYAAHQRDAPGDKCSWRGVPLYRDESGEVMLDLGDYGVAAMKFSKNGVSITDSYLFDNKECLPKIICFVNYYATREGYDIGRSNIELIGEYRLHTILYNIGYKPNQTKTLNWDFNKDPRWYVNTASSFIGWCGL